MNWYHMLRDGLLKRGYRQSDVDPCLFIKDDVLCLIYVDNTIFFANDDKIIDREITDLKKDFNLTEKGDVDAFLGIQLEEHDNGSTTMSQPGLIDQVCKDVGLDKTSKLHDTPTLPQALFKHEDSPPFSAEWSYRSVIGKLSYLSRNTRPDIEFAVHQCARYQSNPRIEHETYVKRICRYLLRTRDKGITFKPAINYNQLDCSVDADYCGAYNHNEGNDPSMCRSRTGYVIKYANCPIIWASKLQTELALSTTEAEYIALSQATRELLPMQELLKEVSNYFNLSKTDMITKCTVFEDNTGAEELARTAKYRPRTKYIVVKYHHFREHVRNGTLQIAQIDTKTS